MKDVTRLRERFLRDGLDRRLGNIASSLLRLNSWLRMARDPQAMVDLMRETATMIELREPSKPHVALSPPLELVLSASRRTMP